MRDRRTLDSIEAAFLDIRREQSKAKRDANRERGLCINENAAGTHGPATHGCRCERCYRVHRGIHRERFNEQR